VIKKSKPEHKKFPIREDGIHKIEVHVAGVCVREEGKGWKMLAAKRKSTRSLFPNKWECGGGAVHSGEGFEAALKIAVVGSPETGKPPRLIAI
jgi:8-oxo-dGTP pyrophosphatase MutT (NUDIX family)